MKKGFNSIKKIFILFVLIFIFVSCDKDTNTKISSEKEVVYIDNIGTIKVVKYEYNGHSYQMHYHSNGNATVAGVIHNPDCKCFKDSIQ